MLGPASDAAGHRDRFGDIDGAAGSVECDQQRLGGSVGHGDCEFVPAHVGYQGILRQRVQQQCFKATQDGITGGVPFQLVDRAEAIKIQDGDSYSAVGRQQVYLVLKGVEAE